MVTTIWQAAAQSVRGAAASVYGGLETIAHGVWRATFVDPLRTLYFNGPNVHGYGFWGGVQAADACAQLTGVSALVWDVQAVACHDLLERNFFSFSVVVTFALYLWLVYKTLQHLAFRYLYVRPLIAELRAALRELPRRETPAFLDSAHPLAETRATDSQTSRNEEQPPASVSVPRRHALVCAPRICRCVSPEHGCASFPAAQRARSGSISRPSSAPHCAAAVSGRASPACACARCSAVASAAAAVQAAATKVEQAAARQEGRRGHQA